jgi:hypothetical protein
MSKINFKEIVPLILISLSVSTLAVYLIITIHVLSAMNNTNYQILIDLQTSVGVVVISVCLMLSTIGLYLKIAWKVQK